MAVEYDASSGMVASAFRFKSTIIPMVVDGPEFWLFLILNLFICCMRHAGLFTPEVYHIDLPWDLTGTTGSLMTFFVVFYNSHVFGRYNKLYDLTKSMLEHCLRTASMLRVLVPDQRVHYKVCRYVLASIMIFFFERTTTEDNEVVSKIEWEQLLELKLLDEAEIEALQEHCRMLQATDSTMPSFMPIQWSMELLRHVTEDPFDRDDMLSAFYSVIYRVWNCQSRISETLDLPMPFQYFHIMNMMLMLNLFLWAYSLGCQDSWFAPLIYMFVQMMFQGLRELSTALSDPYGTDEVDFALNDWIRPIYSQMHAALNQHIDVAQMNISSRSWLDPEYSHKFINMYIDRQKEEEEQARRREKKRRKSEQARLAQEAAGVGGSSDGLFASMRKAATLSDRVSYR
jgi:predicted membrane chloride channel (bestrophin family)